MKKYIFIVFAIALGATATAQKKLYIYNFSDYDVTVSDIMTKHVTNDYPTFVDLDADFVVPAIYGTYELSNNIPNTPLYRFPFSSTANSIPNWVRYNSATLPPTYPVSANGAMVAQSPATNAQIFHCIKYDDGAGAGLLGIIPLGIPELVLPNTIGYYEEFITGTLTEYVIVILNNE